MRLKKLAIALVAIPFFAASAQAVETLTLDPNHTYVLWHVNHLGFSTQAGKWYATGTLQLDKDKPQNSKLNVTIKMADISTGIPELDKHLKGKLFFDTDTFPTATFVSDKVDVKGNKATVHGMLTLHGVTKPETMMVTLNKAGVNPISDKMTYGFSGTTTLKRSDFGVVTLLPALGDEVKLNIESEANVDVATK